MSEISPDRPKVTHAAPSEDDAGMRELRRLEREAQHFAAIVESSDDAIISKDLNSIVLTWNRAAERLFGYLAAEIVGKSIRIIIPDDRQQEEDIVLSRVRAGLRVDHYETIRRRKDGTTIAVSLTVSPIRTADGTIVGASKIARDISDRERAEQERQRLLQIARDASRLKDEFLATLSHELRTPLNGIVGYVRLIQMDLLVGEKRTRAMEAVGRSVTALTQIVEDVLDVSRIVSGKLRLNMQIVDLAAVIESAIDIVRPALDAKGIRLKTAIASDAAQISGDPDRLQQVLWNLLSNAAKFTPRGGEVCVGLESAESFVELTIRDTGAGIPLDFLPYVFDRFRQADAGVTRATGGLGLGLAICRHLVELHGGRIFADSQGPGTGATFRVELPIREAQPAMPVEERPREQVTDEAVRFAVPQLAGFRILAIDDDRDALVLLREILETTGATVVTADSALQALEILDKTTPDVLVVDLGLPEMSGFEFIDRVRHSERHDIRHLPAVAVTAFARSEDRLKALQLGFQLHLPKPVDPGELMKTMETLLTRKLV